MSSATKKHSKNSKKSHPSAAIIAAKKEAVKRQMLQGKKNNQIIMQDIYQKAIDSYDIMHKGTGLVYDHSMIEHVCFWDSNYPECPERFTRIMQRCEELGLISRCKYIEPRSATDIELLTKHTQEQIDVLKATEGCKDEDKLEKLSSKYDAIYIHPTTYKLSLLAVGSTIELVENICKREVQNGMAIIRPPGHHAMKSEYCGYCFFNNVAIAAEKALRANLANRILIVDWDVHHGQATQQMFYDDSRVVYFSIHRYEYGEFWPNLKESDYHYIGDGPGRGYNFNIPLNKTGMTNADYIAIFQQVLLPMAYEFQPDLIIISAGYDAALGCPEGEMEVTPACYTHLLSSLMSLAGGKVAVILEGGYCLKSLAEAAALTLRTLLGDSCPMMELLDLPSLSIRETILNVIYSHKQYWNCYQYQDVYSTTNVISNQEEISNRHFPVVTYRGEVSVTKCYETRNCYPVQSKEKLDEIDKKLNDLILGTSLNKALNRVCICFDEKMLRHSNISDNSHPEKPQRIMSIYKRHEESGLLQRCQILQGRSITLQELLLVHSRNYVESVKDTQRLKPAELIKRGSKYNSVYLHPETWSSACVAAGSLLQVVDNVLNGESQSGIAIIRPPGHHAGEDVACGFCIFNNIAIAARYAIECHHLKRILIVDWDVHHGNGTQNIFEEEPKVLYISVHRYDNGSFFPNSDDGDYTFVGLAKGEGYNVNIPWNKKGMGNAEYIAAFQQVIMPIAYQFNPELVLVSAGFDACIGDPLGGCRVSPEMYAHLTHWLSSLANGRIILALEGGYNIYSISHAMTMCTKALLNDPLPLLDSRQSPCTSAVTSINNVLKVQKNHWPALMFNVSLPKENVIENVEITNTETPDGDNKARKKSEPKIAQERIESEKLDLNLSFDRSMSSQVIDQEITKLQNEIENIKIKTSNNFVTMKDTKQETLSIVSEHIKQCVNPNDSSREKNDRNAESSAGSSSNNNNTENAGASSSQPANTLSSYLSENLQALLAGEMFAVVPLRDCPHLDSVTEVPAGGIDVNIPCSECGDDAENWICLCCYTVHCARSINEHGLRHNEESQHPLVLSFRDLTVWCYGCEAYIDNLRLYAARNAAHRSKFNEELPWTYGSEVTLERQ
ncbi:histone deacetylase 6 isoform X2 [Prorops nasuta]